MPDAARQSVSAPGIYDMPRALYDEDPAPTPSLNQSLAKVLLERSPRHAWLLHPRLNPKFERDKDRKFDLGTAAHDVLFNAGRNIQIVKADDYKTKAAREERDVAIAAGKMPVTEPQMETVDAMARAAVTQIAQHRDLLGIFPGKGKPEQVMLWQEGETWCRGAIDWLPDGQGIFLDYKTTTVSANPEQWARQAYDLGCDIQAVFYTRGLEKLRGGTWECRFIVQESEPPYALSVCALPPSALALGAAKVNEALRIWRWCSERGFWPGYPKETAYIEPPPWHMTRWQEREAIDRDLLELGMRVYAPDEQEKAA